MKLSSDLEAINLSILREASSLFYSGAVYLWPKTWFPRVRAKPHVIKHMKQVDLLHQTWWKPTALQNEEYFGNSGVAEEDWTGSI